MNKVAVGFVRTSLGGSSHSEVLGVVQRLRKPVLVEGLQLHEKIPFNPLVPLDTATSSLEGTGRITLVVEISRGHTKKRRTEEEGA